MSGNPERLEAVSTDLVCGSPVESDNPRFFSEYDQRAYVFCSAECKRAFDDHPDKFIQEQAKKELGLAN
jgi:YHS domain-containing protein